MSYILDLLCSANCDLKICDFGLSRLQSDDSSGPFTEYVCTRWYRAVELLLGCNEYSASIDMWSVGCIFGELLARRPLFPGQNTKHQLQVILSLLGVPSEEQISSMQNLKCKRFLQAANQGLDRHCLYELVVGANPEAVSLLDQLLAYDPSRRCDVYNAITHPYMIELHRNEDEPLRSQLKSSDFEFENKNMDTNSLRNELFKEAALYEDS